MKSLQLTIHIATGLAFLGAVLMFLLDITLPSMTGGRFILGPLLMLCGVALAGMKLCLAAISERRAVALMVGGLVLGGLTILLLVIAFLNLLPDIETELLTALIVTTGAMLLWVGIIGSLLRLRAFHPIVTVLRFITILALTIALLSVLLFTWWQYLSLHDTHLYAPMSRHDTQQSLNRLMAVSLLVTVGLALTTIIIAKSRELTQPITDADLLTFKAVCPRCRTALMLRTHGDQCTHCGLRIRVTPA